MPKQKPINSFAVEARSFHFSNRLRWAALRSILVERESLAARCPDGRRHDILLRRIETGRREVELPICFGNFAIFIGAVEDRRLMGLRLGQTVQRWLLLWHKEWILPRLRIFGHWFRVFGEIGLRK